MDSGTARLCGDNAGCIRHLCWMPFPSKRRTRGDLDPKEIADPYSSALRSIFDEWKGTASRSRIQGTDALFLLGDGDHTTTSIGEQGEHRGQGSSSSTLERAEERTDFSAERSGIDEELRRACGSSPRGGRERSDRDERGDETMTVEVNADLDDRALHMSLPI